MKYSELKQKATQGEWKLDGNINGRQQIASRTKGEPYWIGQFQTVRDTAKTHVDGRTNARLTVHQHEHFDKLLEALENLSQKTSVLLIELTIRGANIKAHYVEGAGQASSAAMLAIKAAQTVKEL